MILHTHQAAKKSPLILCASFGLLALISLVGAGRLSAAKIEVGVESSVSTINVENLNEPGTASLAPEVAPVSPPAVPGATPGQIDDPNDALARRHPHIYTTPVSTVAAGPDLPSAVEKVLQPAGNASMPALNGKGTLELTALRDGEVNLEVYLFTYRDAKIEVSLYDENGEEISFAGQPLLKWERTNDYSFAPVSFKGVADNSSMYEEKPGNFSPRRDLSYGLRLKAGQKLVLKTSGNAESESYIRVGGAAF
jgi:hypothetical protein